MEDSTSYSDSYWGKSPIIVIFAVIHQIEASIWRDNLKCIIVKKRLRNVNKCRISKYFCRLILGQSFLKMVIHNVQHVAKLWRISIGCHVISWFILETNLINVMNAVMPQTEGTIWSYISIVSMWKTHFFKVNKFEILNIVTDYWASHSWKWSFTMSFM